MVNDLGGLAPGVVEHDLLIASAGQDVGLGPGQSVRWHRVDHDPPGWFGRAVLGHVEPDDAAVGVTRQETRASRTEMVCGFIINGSLLNFN